MIKRIIKTNKPEIKMTIEQLAKYTDKSAAWLRTKLQLKENNMNDENTLSTASLIKEMYKECLQLREEAKRRKALNEPDYVALYSKANKIEDDLIRALTGKCLKLDNGKYLMIILSSGEGYGIGEGELIEE